MVSSMRSAVIAAGMAAFALPCGAARQNYDVRKIIEAFRTPHDDLTILCAHRGMRSVQRELKKRGSFINLCLQVEWYH